MRRVLFVPGAVVSPAAITLPATEPDIADVVTAQIIRVPAGLSDHPAHTHDFVSTGIGGAPANAMGLPAGLDAINDAGAVGAHTVAGGGASGVQDNTDQTHSGADPIVAATPTKLTDRTISLNVNTELGDILELNYLEVGERILVS
ncbi:MAG: hypothetical protein WC551_09990 [Patescibacteria group bacterium]